AGPLRCTVYSRVPKLPDPQDPSSDGALREMLLPAVFVELEIDNRSSASGRTAFIGFSGSDPYSGMRRISGDRWCGIGQGRHSAIMTENKAVQTGIGFSAEDILTGAANDRLQSGLGDTALLLFSVPPGRKRTIRCTVCFFRDGNVSTGIEGRYYYRRWFSSVDDVGTYALEHFDAIRTAIEKENTYFASGNLSTERAFMLAHAVRSYYANTELLDTDNGPLWIVNEGEYRMINTIDLTVDHLFFELERHPWTLRNVLDLYARRYAFEDRVKLPGGMEHDGGIAFTHDMGVANVFAPAGRSAYEIPGVKGCFSYMTHEELVNWVITAGVYTLRTGDRRWMDQYKTTFSAGLHSLINRDHPDVVRRSGMMCRDSVLTRRGAEITTYDSLDISLGQARNNAYTTVKRWAAFVLLKGLFDMTDNTEDARMAEAEAMRSAEAVVRSAGSDDSIPALLDGSSVAVALPVVEGLIYPWVAGIREVYKERSGYAPLLASLKKHVSAALTTEICRFDDGGLKLSSSSDITWLSKLYLFRFIATDILGIEADAVFGESDEAQLRWLLDERNSAYAWSDQFRNGVLVGSRYYPRGVTAVLWLREGKARQGDLPD
ncbi:MAG: hypothetical protein JW863_13910, partial [Chitinispirillaceae bacterium]|nr:hypothetical protein [Chitinispirillaceae bacterium]